jgi:hypothetical protein
MNECDHDVMVRLANQAPPQIRNFVVNHCPFREMLEKGVGSTDFYIGELNSISFRDPANFKRQMKVLNRAWTGLVKVEVEDHEDGERLILKLTIIS